MENCSKLRCDSNSACSSLLLSNSSWSIYDDLQMKYKIQKTKMPWKRFMDEMPIELEPIMVSARGYRHMLYTHGPIRAHQLLEWLDADFKAYYWIYVKDM